MSLFKKRRDPMEQMEKELRQETREMEHEVHEMERGHSGGCGRGHEKI